MNALELADWIKDTEFYDNPNPEINDKMDEVEDMLRKLDGQLAFRIDAVTKYQVWIKELEISKQSWEIIAKGYGKTIDEQQAEIEALKEVNTKQVDCISKQKEEYEKLWKEHMELFWKHEQDTDLTNE